MFLPDGSPAGPGIQVTASHNPAVYNGFKMSRRDAIPVSYDTGIDRLEELVTSSDVSTDLAPKADEEMRSIFNEYTRHALAEVTVSEPRLRLAADSANGMGTIYMPILEQLNIQPNGHTFYHGTGSKECNNTGYKGRIAVFELLTITRPINDADNRPDED